MSVITKTYFLCPTSDPIAPPPEGPLCLGSIIRSTSTPQYSLNREHIVAVAEADKIPPVVETDWKKTVSVKKGLGLGVYAQFLKLATAGLPLSPELDLARSTKTANTFAFDTVTTLRLEPSQEYVEEAMKAPPVQAWLKESRQCLGVAELFLVTGMKVVKGARMKYSNSQNTTMTGSIGIGSTDLGVTIGPKGHWTCTDDNETESSQESEFVFAFRVKRLQVVMRRLVGVKDHNKGAFLRTGGGQGDDMSIVVEDVDGSAIETATAVFDATENDFVYCVPP